MPESNSWAFFNFWFGPLLIFLKQKDNVNCQAWKAGIWRSAKNKPLFKLERGGMLLCYFDEEKSKNIISYFTDNY